MVICHCTLAVSNPDACKNCPVNMGSESNRNGDGIHPADKYQVIYGKSTGYYGGKRTDVSGGKS